MMPSKVLVTGSAGRLGREVCKALLAGGFDVRATDRVYRRELPFALEVADLLDDTAAYRLLDGCDAVVHLANYPHVGAISPAQRLYRENVSMDVNVFQAAVDVGVRRIVFSSSVQVFAGDRTDRWGDTTEALRRPSCLAYLPIDGEAPICPRNAYALSKAAGEQMLRYYVALDAELSATCVRYPFLLGERHRMWFRRHIREHDRRGEIHGHPDEGFSYLHLADAASLVGAILTRQSPGYHSLCPTAPDNYVSLPIPEIIERCYPGVPLKVPAEQITSLVDTSRITKTLGWVPEHVNQFDDDEKEPDA